jgi:hypothetical protein
MDSGIVYVVFNKWIRNPETNEMPYKIGITSGSVEDRYYGLGLKMPGEFETLFAYELDDYKKAEKAIQNILNKKCINGEWFNLKQEELDYIENTCKIMGGELVTDEVKEEIETETEDNLIDGEGGFRKSEAIELLNKKLQLNLNNKNTIFSNVNNAKPVWWFEPKNSRFEKDFYLVLNNSENKTLYYFFIPKNEIKEPKLIFYQRGDHPNKSQIEIDCDDINFKDTKKGENGMSFRKYLKEEIKYGE